MKRKMASMMDTESETSEKMADASDSSQGAASDNTDMGELETLYKCNELADITKCFIQLHLNISGEIGTLKKQMTSVRKRVTDTEQGLEYMTHELEAINENEIPKLREQLEKERNDRLKLDLWGRKWNLVIKGMKGGAGEQTEVTEKLFRKLLVEKLGLSTDCVGKMVFQAAHRLAGGPLDCKNCIVRFVSLGDREGVLAAARTLKRDSGISIYPDLPPELAKLRYTLVQKKLNMPEEERKKFKLAYLRDAPFIILKTKW